MNITIFEQLIKLLETFKMLDDTWKFKPLDEKEKDVSAQFEGWGYFKINARNQILSAEFISNK